MKTTGIAVRTVCAALLVLICQVSPAAAQLLGVVQSGGTSTPRPLDGVKVTLYEATTAQPATLATAVSNASGQFLLETPQGPSASIFFVTADVAPGVEFVAILGSQLPASITINELTTVAAAYSMAQFYRTGVISGNAFALQLAAGMNDNLVSALTGESSPVLLGSPNADQTNSLRSTRSLANLVAACERFWIIKSIFFALTRPPLGLPPQNTTQALANLARNPGQNAWIIYWLSKFNDAYEPALVRAPDAWTVTVKVNDTGDDNFLFSGPGGLAFDSKGYAWITDNTVQGTPYSSNFIVALKPNGQPADGSGGTPKSPITGGGLLGTGLGITIAPNGSVWAGNFGWGGPAYNPSPMGNGSVSQFTASGLPISGPTGYQGGPVRVQGMAADRRGNIWISSFGNDSVYVFQNGDPGQALGLPQYTGAGTFGMALAPDGSAWVTNGGGFAGEHLSNVAKFELVNGNLSQQFMKPVGKALKMLAVDSQGNAWVTSQGDSTIYLLDPNGRLINGFSGGGINGPWGITVDGEDNIWVANFGPLQPGSNFTNGRLSKLCGANPNTQPPFLRTGDPISPGTGYTVHSAGEQVLLHNGDPLYGPSASPSFAPMMRQTWVSIDQAGNVWSINNWKPDFDIDATSNPGGDGIIIFVGLAPPPPVR